MSQIFQTGKSKRPIIIKKRKKKVGLPPGTPVFVGRKKTETTKITVIDYDEMNFEEKEVKTVEECLPFKVKPTITWINIDGLHDTSVLEKFGEHFYLHPLLLEDILNTDQRPKIDDYENHLYLVLKMLNYNEERKSVVIEQVSLILGENYVISFQERPEDVFNPIRERIKGKKGKIRSYGADHLFYALIDVIVDNYFLILERLSERIEFLEEEIVTSPGTETLQIIHSLKTNIIFIRKSVWPLRELISRLERGGSALILPGTQKYIRDVYDHTIQVIDTVETLRDIVSGILDIYLSSISNKMNEVMKVLTIIATIVIPMTVVSGIYGMNFQLMPELTWPIGYPMALSLMLLVAIIMLSYFWKKGWL
ncbi:MAG: magnesium/cobalt transporter CorA [Candidatus Heimdallarchaeota archaeon]|nr:MAG: magnesium/cobalt transporter CorA [Candidatus Heimdallarchaeota archaeon]